HRHEAAGGPEIAPGRWLALEAFGVRRLDGAPSASTSVRTTVRSDLTTGMVGGGCGAARGDTERGVGCVSHRWHRSDPPLHPGRRSAGAMTSPITARLIYDTPVAR